MESLRRASVAVTVATTVDDPLPIKRPPELVDNSSKMLPACTDRGMADAGGLLPGVPKVSSGKRALNSRAGLEGCHNWGTEDEAQQLRRATSCNCMAGLGFAQVQTCSQQLFAGRRGPWQLMLGYVDVPAWGQQLFTPNPP